MSLVHEDDTAASVWGTGKQNSAAFYEVLEVLGVSAAVGVCAAGLA
jgi:hypothetical protein